MSMLSEQVNKIRKVAKCVYLAADKEISDDIASTLNQAADTIEALSAKLEAANMDNGGGWIACEDRLPEEHKLYDITFENSVGIHSDSAIYNPYLKRWLWDADETELVENKVLAWAEKREPYRP